MWTRKKNILKHSSYVEGLSEISPAKFFIPEWYRNQPVEERKASKIKQLPMDPNFRSCSPFLDSFTLGYMITLPVDIAIMQDKNGPVITWSGTHVEPIIERPTSSNQNLPTPNGFSSKHYAWQIANTLKIPEGYSALITNPLNRLDLPFVTLSGVVDGEMVLHGGNMPVFISSSFEGLIKQGTPIAQVILFKREDWTSEIDRSILEQSRINEVKSSSVAFGWYKKDHWKKKSFE